MFIPYCGWKIISTAAHLQLKTKYNPFTFLSLRTIHPTISLLVHKTQLIRMAECAKPQTSIPLTGSNDKINAEGSCKTLNVDQNCQQISKEPLSKRALKRIARAEKYKEFKKKKKETSQDNEDDINFTTEDLKQSSYYFENGLRKVYPYNFLFTTHAKGRWLGKKLFDVLLKEFGFNDPEDLSRAFESKSLRVNNNPASLNYVLKDGDYITHHIHRHENPVISEPLEIIADNEDVLVINKPSSIPCHPCGRYRFNSVAFILAKEMGYTNLRNLYRLDRLTSGLLILCKKAELTRKLMDQIAKRQVQKEYICRVVGKFPDGIIKVDKSLMPLSNKLRLQVVSPMGKPSQTTFTRLSYNGKSSVVKCIPHTGRTHQIRVHLQYLGYPIVNDVFYNNDAWGPNKGKDGVYEIPFDEVCERILKEHHATQWDGGDNPHYEDKLKELQTEGLHNKGASCEASSYLCPDEPPSKQRRIEISATTLAEGQAGSCSSDSKSQGLDRPESFVSERPGFDLAKLSVDPSCQLCKKTTIDPKGKDLIMFLHAFKYKGLNWAYETPLPEWSLEDWSKEEEYAVVSVQ